MSAMVDGWRSVAGVSAEENAISGAIAETEKEIFDSAFDDAPVEHDYDDSLEQMEEFDGETHPDDYYTAEHFGHDHAAEADQVRAENAALRQHIASQQQPEPVPDIFADPEGYLQQVTRLAAEGRLGGQLPGHYQTPAWDGPDIFAQPEAALAHAAMRGAQLAETARFDSDRVNSSMRNAHENYGSDFEEAFSAITSLDRRNPNHQAIVSGIWGSPDPGQELIRTYAAILARDQTDRRMGGQGFLPRRTPNYAERAHGLNYEPPTTDEGRIEEQIFNSAWD
jgi:hypothetical protein